MEVKIIPAIICLLMFGLFAAPILTHILNVGNIAGMLISGILTLIFIDEHVIEQGEQKDLTERDQHKKDR